MLRPELLARIAPLALACAACALVSVAIARYAALRVPRLRRPFAEHGTSELEFTLALPFFLMSVLTTVQIALMVNANLVVDYAAFAAARSASVWVPQDVGDEGTNSIAAAGTNSEKWSRIRRAATIAVLPISPRMLGFRFGLAQPPSPMQLDGPALAELAEKADVQPNRSIDYVRLGADMLNKWLYADNFTDVVLVDGGGNAQRQFSTGAPLTARVTHKFEMAVPFAGPILGAAFGQRYLGLFGGYYVPIAASYSLMVWAAQ